MTAGSSESIRQRWAEASVMSSRDRRGGPQPLGPRSLKPSMKFASGFAGILASRDNRQLGALLAGAGTVARESGAQRPFRVATKRRSGYYSDT